MTGSPTRQVREGGLRESWGSLGGGTFFTISPTLAKVINILVINVHTYCIVTWCRCLHFTSCLAVWEGVEGEGARRGGGDAHV